VPLLDEIVHVNRSGTMAERTVPVSGHVWDLTGSLGQLWALAETAIYRITERTGVSQRIGLKAKVGVGVQSNHVTADGQSVWVSSYPRSSTTTNPGHLTRINPGDPPQVTVSRIYPGAGALALVDGGLWVARFDGQGELDRLNAATGALTGPFLVMPASADPTVLVARGDDLWVLSYVSSGNQRTVTKVTLTAAAPAAK
jgi:sugar lactone lactonase YvrE